MRIALVCGEYPPGSHGGIGTVTQVLARALVRAGHEVRVIGTTRADNAGAEREDDEGVQVWRLREASHRLGWMRPRLRLLNVLTEWSRRGEVELIEVPDYAGPAAGWPRLGVPVVVRAHGSVSYFAAELGQPAQRGMFWLERASLHRADAWSAVSRYAADRTRELFGLERVPPAVLYNPVELPADATAPRSAREVVFTGTLTAKKGVLSLADAWPVVRAACGDAELHVYGKDVRDGDGRSMRQRLVERLGEHAGSVHFHGHVSRGELLRVLQTARAAVFPSFAEAFAMAPLESMASGAPTIYSRRGSGAEIIDHGRTGLLVEPGRPDDIGDAIVRLLTDDALAARLGAAGREHVRQHFAIGAVVRENETFYERSMHDFQRPRAERAAVLHSIPRG
jgi:glycosyltransferase involved in cell wall biosynthesis